MFIIPPLSTAMIGCPVLIGTIRHQAESLVVKKACSPSSKRGGAGSTRTHPHLQNPLSRSMHAAKDHVIKKSIE